MGDGTRALQKRLQPLPVELRDGRGPLPVSAVWRVRALTAGAGLLMDARQTFPNCTDCRGRAPVSSEQSGQILFFAVLGR